MIIIIIIGFLIILSFALLVSCEFFWWMEWKFHFKKHLNIHPVNLVCLDAVQRWGPLLIQVCINTENNMMQRNLSESFKTWFRSHTWSRLCRVYRDILVILSLLMKTTFLSIYLVKIQQIVNGNCWTLQQDVESFLSQICLISIFKHHCAQERWQEPLWKGEILCNQMSVF